MISLADGDLMGLDGIWILYLCTCPRYVVIVCRPPTSLVVVIDCLFLFYHLCLVHL